MGKVVQAIKCDYNELGLFRHFSLLVISESLFNFLLCYSFTLLLFYLSCFFFLFLFLFFFFGNLEIERMLVNGIRINENSR